MESLIPSQQVDAGGLSGANLGCFIPMLSHLSITVLNPHTGHIQCPGGNLHTQPTAANHCTLHNNGGVLRIHCFHQSCRQVVEKYNRVLWKHSSRQRQVNQPVSTFPQMAAMSSVPKSSLAFQWQQPSSVLGKILQAYPWTYQDIINDPVGKVIAPDARHHLLLLNLFPSDDILWVAPGVRYSGGPAYARYFRPALDWSAEEKCPGVFICPNAFRPGVTSRCNVNIVQKRFLVVESDTLSKDEVGAVFRYLMSLGFELKAVVDTAGKSLHGWFVYPGETEAKRLSRELPKLGCDPQMFSVSQPVRLPGALRNGNYQKLVYFNP